MDLSTLWVLQRSLRNPAQLAALVAAVRDGRPLPPILLSESADDSVQIEDGHHRACAYALAGRTALGFGEYVLVGARPRPRFGRLADLLARVERRA